jgi:hypothetical protein
MRLKSAVKEEGERKNGRREESVIDTKEKGGT